MRSPYAISSFEEHIFEVPLPNEKLVKLILENPIKQLRKKINEKSLKLSTENLFKCIKRYWNISNQESED